MKKLLMKCVFTVCIININIERHKNLLEKYKTMSLNESRLWEPGAARLGLSHRGFTPLILTICVSSSAIFTCQFYSCILYDYLQKREKEKVSECRIGGGGL